MSEPLILVTGSSGRIGRAAVEALKSAHCRVRGFDLVPTPGVPDMVVGTLTDAAAVQRATRGVHTLIHLAATPDDADFLTEIVPNNLVGVYHVLEAAREARVQRAILASSGQVVWWQRFQGPYPIGTDAAPSPRYWYACSKLFLEGAGRSFAEQFGMQVLAVRLGWCPRTKEQVDEIAANPWAQDVYLSPVDAGRFFLAAVRSEMNYRFAVVYAASNPLRDPVTDLNPARELVGYIPQDRWPDGIDVILQT